MDDHVSYKQALAIPGLFLSTARFTEFSFEPHYHLDCHIALVADGVQRQSFRGGSLLLTRGAIQLMPAGEVHDGKAPPMSRTRSTPFASRRSYCRVWARK